MSSIKGFFFRGYLNTTLPLKTRSSPPEQRVFCPLARDLASSACFCVSGEFEGVYLEVHKSLISFLYDLLYRQRDVTEGVEQLEDLLEVFGRDVPIHLQGS